MVSPRAASGNTTRPVPLPSSSSGPGGPCSAIGARNSTVASLFGAANQSS